MARRSFRVTGTNNSTKQVSVDWTNDLAELTELGIAAMPQDYYEATDPNYGSAFSRAVSALNDNAAANIGWGGGKLYIPKSNSIYDLGSTTLDLKSQIDFCGAGVSSTILRWQSDATGIRVQRYNTEGATAVSSPTHGGGDYSTIRDLTLYGTGATNTPYASEGEYHGIQLRARATIRNVHIYNFKGDGIYNYAAAGGGAGSEGNTNLFRIEHVKAQGCRNGLYVNGPDANAGTIIGFDATSCRRWGILDSSFLGNTYIGCHVDASAVFDGGIAVCSHNGKLYAVVHGQESGASTNAPSGTTASNTWWSYMSAGDPAAGYGRRAWTSGLTWRSGGAYCSDEITAENEFFGCYSESGQAPSQMNYPAKVWGGLHGASVIRIGYGTPYGAWLDASLVDGFNIFRDLRVGHDLTVINDATITGGLYANGGIATTGTHNLDGNLSLSSGRAIYNNGNQVVGARGASVADATDNATAITQLNALLARLRAHGLIAT